MQVADIPAPSVDPSLLSLEVGLQSSSVRIDEPLVVTCVLRNTTSQRQLVPMLPPDWLLDCSLAWMSLLDSRGREYIYRLYYRVSGIWWKEYCYPVAPQDSMYWRFVVHPEDFRTNGWDPLTAAGGFKLAVGIALPLFVPGQTGTNGFSWIHDTVLVNFVRDRSWEKEMHRHRPGMARWLGTWFIGLDDAEVCADLRTFRTTTPTSSDGSLYLDYVLPRVMTCVDSTWALGIKLAHDFIEAHPQHPLAEEMLFDMLRFYYRRRELDQDCEDHMAELLVAFPRNTRCLTLDSGRESWRAR